MFEKSGFSVWGSVIIILLIIFLGGCSSGSGGSNSLYNVSGKVENENGVGIGEVYISYSGSNATGSTKTLSDGSWKLSALKGSITITPNKEGYIFDPINHYVTSARDNVNFIADEVVIDKTELKTETLKVSNQSQTVEYKDEIRVTIPGGVLSTGTELTISALNNYPIIPGSDGIMAIFDVEIAGMNKFSEAIEIEFSYNPSDIPEGKTANDMLKAVHWNADENLWEAKPIIVDEENSKATLYTDALSPVGLFMDSDLVIKDSEHFRLTYGKKMFIDPKEWKSQEEMADKLLDFLENYYSLYTVDNDFNVPPAHWFQDGKILVRLDDDYVESEWSWKTGAIFMTSYNGREELKEEVAHELFHAVQNSYYTTTVEMLFVGRRWWMEATADYAANIIAGAGSLEPLKSDYFIKPLSMQNGKHEYQTAHFIDYIVKENGINFIEMWESITDNSKIQVLESLDDYLYMNTKKRLPYYYHNFARHMFFSDSAALKGSPVDLGVSSNLLAEANSVAKTFNILENGTVSLWVVDVGVDNKKESRYLEFELDEDLALGTYVDIYISGEDRLNAVTPLPNASLKYSDNKVLLEVPKDKLVYILASNTGKNISTFNLTIRDRDPELSITPEVLTGEYGEDYTFKFKAENLGEEIDNLKFSWDFGDGIVDDSSNLSKGETIVAVQNGTAEINVSHKYLAEGDFSIDLKVFDQSGKELEQAEAAVKIDLEQEVVITGARQFIWELRDGATETEHDFEAVVQPRDTGEYEFEWNFGDGIISSEIGESSNVSHLYTDLKDGDFFIVKVTLYSLAGEKLAEDSISIEVIEEQAEIVEFIDPNLEAVVREKLEIPSREMTAADLEELTSFSAVNEQISNLTGLEFAVNLRTVRLDKNSIRDLSPLASLTDLESVYLSENEIINIQPLLNSTKLRNLYLQENQITDIATLFSDLTELEELRLDNNQIRSVNGVAEESKLTRLSLQDNNLSSVDLRGFPNVLSVGLENNELSTINLDGFSAATAITAYNNNLTSTAGFKLSQKTNLYRLSLAENQISNIEGLRDLENLMIIDLRNNLVSDITGLSNLPSLETLSLHNNRLANIDVLLDFDQLETVYLRENPDLITNDDKTHDGTFYPRSQAREVIETLKSREVEVYFEVVNPY